ncbi:MAG: serine protease [Terriglobia bacterium]
MRTSNIVYYRSFCLLPFALCVLTCLSFPIAASSQAPAQKPPPQYDRVLRAVVQLLAVGPANQDQNQECSATGFLINEDGYLITNWHVVEAAKGCLEKAPGAKILAKLAVTSPRTARAVACDVVALDEPNDLALLKAERPLVPNPGEMPPFATLDTHAVAVGMAARVSGYPAFSWQPVTQSGSVVWIDRTGLRETDAPSPPPSDAVGIDIHLRPGNSGSPVYRPGGGVIAVVDKRDPLRPEYSVAVAIHYAIELAQRNGVRWHGVD